MLRTRNIPTQRTKKGRVKNVARELSAKRNYSLADGFFMNLKNVNGHAASSRKLLMANMAFEVFSLLMLNQNLLIIELPITVVAPYLIGWSLLLLPHLSLQKTQSAPPSSDWIKSEEINAGWSARVPNSNWGLKTGVFLSLCSRKRVRVSQRKGRGREPISNNEGLYVGFILLVKELRYLDILKIILYIFFREEKETIEYTFFF